MAQSKFQIGDRVRHSYSGEVHTITWVSKCGDLIATEVNLFCNPYVEAASYSKAQKA